MRAVLWSMLLPFAIAGCGGGGAPSPDRQSTATAAAAKTPEDECLAQAGSARTPRADAPESIVVSHILVRHEDLPRPEGATRTRGQACLRALEAREKLLAGAEWERVVAEYSDAGSATAGSLGRVKPSELDATFAAAAFSLDVGELGHVVETERGFHVIARSE